MANGDFSSTGDLVSTGDKGAQSDLEATFGEVIGSYEAKTHLPRILKEVEAGREFTVTRNGKAIAKIVPIEGGKMSRKEAIERLKELRREVNFKLPEGMTYKDMANWGRKY